MDFDCCTRLSGIAAAADIGRLTGCLLLHQIRDRVSSSGWSFLLIEYCCIRLGIGFSLVDGISHFDQSRDPILLYRDTYYRDTLLVWVAPLECHSGGRLLTEPCAGLLVIS